MPKEFPKMKPGQFCIQFNDHIAEEMGGMPDGWDPIYYSEPFDSLEELRAYIKKNGPYSWMAPERSIRNHLNQDIRDVEKNE